MCRRQLPLAAKNGSIFDLEIFRGYVRLLRVGSARWLHSCRMLENVDLLLILDAQFTRIGRSDTLQAQCSFFERVLRQILRVQGGLLGHGAVFLIALDHRRYPAEERDVLDLVSGEEVLAIGALDVADLLNADIAHDTELVRITTNDGQTVGEENIDDVVVQCRLCVFQKAISRKNARENEQKRTENHPGEAWQHERERARALLSSSIRKYIECMHDAHRWMSLVVALLYDMSASHPTTNLDTIPFLHKQTAD